MENGDNVAIVGMNLRIACKGKKKGMNPGRDLGS